MAKAKTTLAEKQDALKTAQAKTETAKAQVDAIQATLEIEQAKLDELQDKFDKLQDLEEKAKDNVIATLPDGTIIAIPNTAPTAEELPEIDIEALKNAIESGKDVEIIDGKVIVRDTKAVADEKPLNVEHPKINSDKFKNNYAGDKKVTIDNKGNVIEKGQTYTNQQQVSSKPIYSRVERAKTLPETGEQSNVALIALGGILGAFGIATLRKKR